MMATSNQKAFDKLSLAQRKKLFFKPCKTKEELSKFIQLFMGFHLPDQTVSRFADTNPLEIVWQVYDICVNKNNPDDIEELLYVAGRGSGKCVERGTIISTPEGPRYIENVNIGQDVYTGSGHNRKVTQTFYEGHKDGLKIITGVNTRQGAFPITGSLRHRVQAVQDDGSVCWKYLPDLEIGDWLYKTTEMSNIEVNTSSDDFEKGWIVGCIAGDGHILSGKRHISLSGGDAKQMAHYANMVKKHFGISTMYRFSRREAHHDGYFKIVTHDKDFKNWVKDHLEGRLAYEKKLKTLEHSYEFLSGFFSGMMDTDGSHDSITLANRDLTYQLSQIACLFGSHSIVNNCRRKPRYSKIAKRDVEYYSASWKTKLHHALLPLFSKREKFLDTRNKMNEQFRYPNNIVKEFGAYIKDKYEIANGYWRLSPGNKTHSDIKYAKELWGKKSKRNNFIYGHKVDYFIELAEKLNEHEWADKLQFFREGYYEQVTDIIPGKYEFYDLEVEVDHAYVSNGFVSHNTLGMAIAELLVLLHDARDVCHVGAVMAQAKRCYEYQTKFMLSPRIRPLIEDKNIPMEDRVLQRLNMEKSSFNVNNQITTLEVLPCTLKACNGPHVPLVITDEIDTVSGEGLKAFREISGMLDSRGDKRALRVGISTRKSRYGLMNKMIEDADQAGRHVRKWTAFEFTDRCPDSRSGTKPTDSYHILDEMEVISEADYKLKDDKKKKEYVKHVMPGEKCLKCPAAAICLGDAKNQQSKSWMLKPISELIQKVRSEGADWALAQLMNLKPSMEGIIYKEFDEKVNVKNWNDMWETLTGTEYPGECTHDIFVKKCHSMNLQCYAGVDWGWSNPNTVVYFFVDKKDNIYVVRADGMTYVSQPEWVNYIKHKYHHLYRCQLYFPDIADQGAVTEMRKAGLPVSSDNDKAINTGIQVIKKYLKVPGSNETKIHLAKETTGPLVEEFLTYHFKTAADGTITEMPESESDHWLDALRYAMTMLFGKGTLVIGNNMSPEEDNKVTDDRGYYHRAPTAEEFAKANNLELGMDQDTSKLGKSGKLSDLDDDDDDWGGDGGFLWSL